ncbi:MSMEG_1061 family FMN-dependent PPOX-type flavoprotein [Intrasporangium sp.]|uniref:MSMEG_1061 family FMN-dependent PPOX-type flavoprotein n=1 Tax=Intrasporangium sp. TaxID=1925024 RepID=UPI00293B1D92|nr:MSMEG_1061 family FMN-dependent PPOX-type flavoprotein [Intrasporangium sp.]MDV3221521.1 pyridoxamine 5'-phosphate oxidase family protein [Intrasporangium sp.]
MNDLHTITSVERLLEVYPNQPGAASIRKESPVLTPAYAAFVEAAPFCVVSTVGQGGLDQSPRGDAPGFVRVRDERSLVIPDRRGNNRLDTLRNLIADPRVGLLFLVPGVGHELRVRGTALVSTDPEELARHEVRGARPASVLVVTVERVYFQCARAIKRSRLWDPGSWPDPASVPSAGRMTLEAGGFESQQEAQDYDAALDERQNATLY